MVVNRMTCFTGINIKIESGVDQQWFTDMVLHLPILHLGGMLQMHHRALEQKQIRGRFFQELLSLKCFNQVTNEASVLTGSKR
jgi:hypothetical protein